MLAVVPSIIDNSDPGFTTEGEWSFWQSGGYDGNVVFSTAPFDGQSKATWSFDVTPGLYRIAATWHQGNPNFGSNVPVVVYDGTDPLTSPVIVASFLDQKSAPNDFVDQNTWWENIGVFNVEFGITVVMTDNADGIAIADAIRVAKIDTSTTILDNSSTAFSTTGSWTVYGPAGYASTIAFPNSPFNGGDTATWATTLSPGSYRVSITWHGGYYTYGSNVPVAIYDNTTLIGFKSLNQTIGPNDLQSNGVWWEDLGTFAVSNSLKVIMTDNANGTPIADAIRIERLDGPPSSMIVDNSSTSFAKTGSWLNYSPSGYAGNITFPTSPYVGTDKATWTFEIEPGTYKLAATWHGGHSTYASNAPLNIYDGDNYLGSALLNQRLSPNDFSSQNTWWENVGVFTVWDTLRVEMTDNANGIPIADAFRIERVSAATIPVARDDSEYYTPAGVDLAINATGGGGLLANDVMFDGPIVRASLVTSPSHGSLLSFDSAGGFTYRPQAGFVGIDSFTYRVQAENGEESLAKASIAVGRPLLARSNPDQQVRNGVLNDRWLQTSVLEPANPQLGIGTGLSNVPEGSSERTLGDLAATGILMLVEDAVQDTPLIYRSESLTNPIITVDTQLAPGLPLPSALTAQLTFNGVPGAIHSYKVSELASGQRLRFALQADIPELETGYYDYSLQVTITVGGTPITQTFSGGQAIVNRRHSEFGSGWMLEELDRLYEQTNGALIVKGNGDAYWFPLVAGAYTTPAGELSHSQLSKQSNGSFKLTSKFGVVSTFSSTGLLLSRADSNSNTVSYNYGNHDGDGLVDEIDSIVDAYGRSISFAYNGSRVSGITHYSGKQTLLNQAAPGLQLLGYSLPDPDPSDSVPAPAIGFVYGNSQLQRVSAVEEVTTFDFDADHGRLISVEFPHDANLVSNTAWQIIPTDVDGLTIQTSDAEVVDPAQVKATVTDQRVNQWRFQTDAFGEITSSETPLGAVRDFLRDKNGRLVRYTEPDPDGPGDRLPPISYWGYNAAGDLTFSEDANGAIERFGYTLDLHRVAGTQNAVGDSQAFGYDSLGNMLYSVDGENFITRFTVNSRGLTTSITPPDPDGTGPVTSPVTAIGYDTLGRIMSVTNPDGSVQSYTYNPANQQLTAVDELGKVSTSQYDGLGRLTSYQNRVQAVYQWEYDDASRLTHEIDPLLNTIEVQYTPRGWIDKILYPDPDGAQALPQPVNLFTYDPVGNVLKHGDPRGFYTGLIPYTYDEENRIKTIGTAVSGEPVDAVATYHYDAIGRIVAIDRVPYVDIYDDQYDVNTQFPAATDNTVMVYDDLGRVIERYSRQKSGVGTTVWFEEKFEYDGLGRLVKTTDGQGNVSTNVYDGRGLLVRETSADPDGAGSQFPLVTRYQYDNMGRLVAEDRGFQRVTSYQYNSRSWVTQVVEPDPDGAGGLVAPTSTFGYNTRGDQTSITDAMGRTTTYQYDDEQRLLFQIDPDPDGSGPLPARTTGYVYFANDWLRYITDSANQATTAYEYDKLGRPVRTIEPDPDGAGPKLSPTTQYTYGANGLTAVIDAMNHTTSYLRDARGRTVQQVDPFGNVTDYRYDFYDNLRMEISPDPDGTGGVARSVTEYDFDAYNRLVEIQEPWNGQSPSTRPTTTFNYDLASNLTVITDPSGNATQRSFDGLNRIYRESIVVGGNELARSRVYDVAGNLRSTKDRNGRVIAYEYDKLDRQVSEEWDQAIIEGRANTVLDGKKINEEQTVGWTVSPGTTSLNGTFTLTWGGYTTAPLAWNADTATIQAALAALPGIGVGNVSVAVSKTNFFGLSIKLVFRAAVAGQNVSQVNMFTSLTPSAGSTVVKFAQTNVQGQAVAEKQSVGFQSLYGNYMTGTWYMSFGGEVTEPLAMNASANVVASALNALPNLDDVTVTGTNGTFEVTFAGSQVGLNMSQILVDASGLKKQRDDHWIETIYNSVGEVVRIREPLNFTFRDIEYIRDNLGQATEIRSDHNGPSLTEMVLNQAFDAAGNRIQLSATLDGTADFVNSYAYDKLNRLTEVIQEGRPSVTWVKPKRVAFDYNALGQTINVARFESASTANPVATTDYLYDTANRLYSIDHRKGTTQLQAYFLQYDGVSRVDQLTSGLDGMADYGYDARSQLTEALYTNHPADNFVFSYDESGNRAGAGYSTSVYNRVEESEGGTYEYDNEGNLTHATNGSGNWYYTWDHRNRLVEASRNGQSVYYEYDAYNRLIRRSTTSSEGTGTHWVYDEGINPILQYGNGDSQLYLWSDAVDDLLAAEARTGGPGPGNVLWPLADHLGTMADIADLNETTGTTSIVNHRRYDAFGNLQSETNAAVDLIFGFTGKYLDEFTGLQNNLNRWYSSELGRFVSQDPIGFAAGDANLYRYVGNEPVTNVDPFGLEETSRSRLRSLFGGAASSNSANASRLGNLAAETGLYSTARHRRAYQGALNVQDALAETIPGAGSIYSAGKAVTGYNPITGKPLGLWEIGLGLLGAVTGVGDDALRAGRGGLKRISDDVVGTAADASKGVRKGGVNSGLSRLVHLTDDAGQIGIAKTGTINGSHGIFAVPTNIAQESTALKVLRTGLTPGKTKNAVPIPNEALELFKRPVPIGPYSGWKFFGGVQYAPAGSISTTTGALSRTSTLVGPKVLIYGPDGVFYVGIAAAGGLYIYGQTGGGE